VAVQGFGNVGEAAARIFAEHGAKIVALQDDTGTLYSESGIDVALARARREQAGGLKGLAGADALSAGEFWGVPCDFLIPAAVENQITQQNAAAIKARIVVEGANGPTTPQADLILQERGITVVPDVLANAGGVTVSYFEWVQDISSFFWSEAEINQRLDRIMTEAFNGIWEVAQARALSLRTAAFVVGCSRVLEARALRGLYP
jgi:glutamate dehydrogenase (NAD(P)+)